MPINDPQSVQEQYASEQNLRARQALYEEDEGPHPWVVLWEALVEGAPRRVLEVGGGPGELSERMQRELGADVAYVDISPHMVGLARERGVDAHLGDVQALPFADESFDTAVAAWMLYHVPDLARGIAELARVLDPGGRLVAVTNSERHLFELRDLIAYPAREFELFSRENGEEYLRPSFSHVERRDADGLVTVRDRAKLAAYQESLQVATQPVPDEVELPFVVHRACSIFVATK